MSNRKQEYKTTILSSTTDENPERLKITILGSTTDGKRGKLIFDLGGIPEKEMQKLREEADRLGKTSFAFGFYLDQQKVTSPKIVTHEMLFGKKQQKRNQNGAYSKAVRELERRKISKKGHGQNF